MEYEPGPHIQQQRQRISTRLDPGQYRLDCPFLPEILASYLKRCPLPSTNFGWFEG